MTSRENVGYVFTFEQFKNVINCGFLRNIENVEIIGVKVIGNVLKVFHDDSHLLTYMACSRVYVLVCPC